MAKNIRCIIVDDEPVAREILETHLSRIEEIRIVASCKSAMEAFRLINREPVDLIFLDINMPEISGLSFARSMTRDIKVIFTTAHREYAVEGFNLQAVDYLLKPVSFERLLQAVNKFLDENRPLPIREPDELIDERTDSFFVRSDRKMVKINFADIRYMESIGDYIKIHLDDRTVVTRETLADIEAKIPQKDFLRVHRSYIVAYNSIDSYTNEYVEVDRHMIPISRSYKNAVLTKLEGNN